MSIILRNSDIATFKECKQKWDFSSPHRQNLKPNKEPSYFGFGTAIHRAAEVWYNPTAPYQDVLALDAFLEEWAKYVHTCFDPQEWSELRDLGIAMLRGYFKFAIENDDFVPVRTEVEFEIPIVVPAGVIKVPEPFSIGSHVGHGEHVLMYEGEPVLYAGRVDLVGRRSDRTYVFADHKTAGKWYDLDHLDMDEQLARYAYALWRLGIPIEHIYYNQLLKAQPAKPELLERRLKSGETKRTLSKNKSAVGVTAETYKAAVVEHGLRMADYREHIEYLERNPPVFFRRTVVTKTVKQYEVIGKRLFLEALDMLGSPNIYPAPNGSWSCKNCAYREPCQSLNDGESPHFILTKMYHTNEGDTN